MSKELVEKVFEKFEEHLNLPNNNRIIFSGKFGIGKSYFLNEFFKDEQNDKKYFTISLNPVNYSIASNQDIFELIKFDILFQILEKDIINFENFDFTTGNLVYQYFSNKFLNDFVSNANLLGEVIIDGQIPKSYSVLKNLGKLISKIAEVGKSDYDKFKNQIEENPDLKIIQDFFDKEQLKIGSFYENNAVTQLIYQLIKNIEEITNKKSVLLIDDLDRIDPEHIFRILNIFSAHDREGENKFGFEKIILVCDLNNIESIYHHFYGEKADFFGYINKFYSFEPYLYSNKFYINYFNECFKVERFYDGEYLQFIKYIFAEAISQNFISARQLFSLDFSKKAIQKLYSETSNKSYNVVYQNKNIYNFHRYVSTYSMITIFIKYFGNSDLFLNFILKQENNYLQEFKETFVEFLGFLIFHKENKENEGRSFIIEEYNLSYKIENGEIKINNLQNFNLQQFYIDIIKKFNEIIIDK